LGCRGRQPQQEPRHGRNNSQSQHRAEAKEGALAACRKEGGRNCKIVTTWSNGGCGYATTGKNRRGQLGWGAGPTSADALKNCTKQGLKCGVPIGGCTLAQ